MLIIIFKSEIKDEKSMKRFMVSLLMECVFCQISAGKSPAHVIYSDEQVMAILDKYPVAIGHTLVMPRNHFENLLEVDDDTLSRLIIVTKRIAKAVKEAVQADGINIITNVGYAAGQVIRHAHIHIIPRFNNDSLRFIFTREDVSEKEKEIIAKKIREKLMEF